MAQFARVTTFEADDAALAALLSEIAAGNPPEGVPARSVLVLTDRAAGTVVVSVRFDSEEDLRTGAATLDAMQPPSAGKLRRVSVGIYEVALEREMA
jgi:hypothetical protein